MRYQFRVDLGNTRRLSVSRRTSYQAASRGSIYLEGAINIGESLSVSPVFGQLKIRDIEHNTGSRPTLVLDGTNLT